MKKFTTLTFIAALTLLAACAEPLAIKGPYTLGQYRIGVVEIAVNDGAGSKNAEFNEGIKNVIAEELTTVAPTDATLPEIDVTSLVTGFAHSTAGGYAITSQVTLFDPKSREPVASFPLNVNLPNEQSGVNINGLGFLGGMASALLTVGIDHAINGEENPEKTKLLISNYAKALRKEIYPKK